MGLNKTQRLSLGFQFVEYLRDTEDIPKILEEKNKDRMDEDRKAQEAMEKELENERIKREQGSLDDQTKLKTKIENVFNTNLDALKKHILDAIDDYTKKPEYHKIDKNEVNVIQRIKGLFKRSNKDIAAYIYSYEIDIGLF